jgi:hypothetical protein
MATALSQLLPGSINMAIDHRDTGLEQSRSSVLDFAYKGEIGSQIDDFKLKTAGLKTAQPASQNEGFLDLSAPIMGSNAKPYEQFASLSNNGVKSDAQNVSDRADANAKGNAQEPEHIGYSELLKKSKVLGFPDNHESVDNKEAFAKSLPEFAEHGGKSVGMELLPQSMQETLNKYTKAIQAQQNGDHSQDEFIKETRKQIIDTVSNQMQFSNDPKLQHDNAAAIADIVDSAAKAGLQTVALEPDVPQPYANGHGYQLLRSGIQQLPPALDQSLKNYMGGSQSDRAALENYLTKTQHWSPKQVTEFFKTLDTMRDSNPPVNLAAFDAAISKEREHPGSADMRNVIQDFRNATFADTINHQQGGEPMVIFAGKGHFDSNPTPIVPGQEPNTNGTLFDPTRGVGGVMVERDGI